MFKSSSIIFRSSIKRSHLGMSYFFSSNILHQAPDRLVQTVESTLERFVSREVVAVEVMDVWDLYTSLTLSMSLSVNLVPTMTGQLRY